MADYNTNYEQYNLVGWGPGMPITQARMTHLDEGIQSNREDARDLNDRLATVATTANAAKTTADSKLTQAQVDDRIAQQISGIQQQVGQGNQAWTAITAATTSEEQGYGGPYANLTTRFRTDESLISDLKKALGQIYDTDTNTYQDIYTENNTVSSVLGAMSTIVNQMHEQVFSAASIGKDPTTGIPNTSISQHMTQIDTQLTSLNTTLDTILTATGTDDQGERISMSTRMQELIALKQEIEDAHRAVEQGEAPDTLALRFASIDTLITALQDNKVNRTDIVNELTRSDTNKPLSAAMGKQLKDTIGGSYNATNTVASAIDTAQTTAEQNAQSYADTNKIDKTSIYNDLDKTVEGFVLDARQGKALKEAIDAIDDALNTSNTGLVARVTANEGAIDTLNGDASTNGSVLNTVNTQIATVVAEAPTAFDTLKEIADWIGDHSDDALEMQQNITALQNAVNDETTGLAATKAIADAAAVKTEVNSALNGLDTRLDAIDGGSTLVNAKTLATRVSEAETAITNLQNEPKSATEIVAVLPQTGDATKDYLLGPNEDGKYFYYKWIVDGAESNWKLISGGGSGEGNTSGFDLSAAEYDALEEHEENTDYYVTRADGIHHYRYIPIEDVESGEMILTEIEIGQFIDVNKIKRYNIATSIGEVEGEEVTYLNLYQYDYNELNNNIDTERAPFTQIVLPKGGSGSTSTSINKLTRIGDQTIQKIVDSQVLLRVFYSSWDSDGAESSAGTYTLMTGNTVVSSGTLNSGAQNVDLSQGWQENTTGFYEFDVTNYCSVGNTIFNLSVTVNGVNLGKDWTVNIIDLHLESEAPEVLLISADESYNFPYTAFGALTKTLHIIIDNDTEHEITQTLSSVTSGRAAYASIPAQEHGAHKIEMYLTATVGGIPQTTSSIIREYIWYDVENTEETLILASPKNGQTITAQQYATIEIPYQVYKKNATSIVVDYYADDILFGSITLEDVNTGILSYLATDQGPHTLKIMVDNDAETALIINLNITELPVNVAPIAGAVIDFDPTMLTNSSTNRLPSWTVGANTYSLTASDNFNWSEDTSGGGYKTDADGKAFVIKAGSYVDLNYPMFARSGNNNVLTNGAEMKIIFKVGAVRDINAVWYQNVGTLTEKTVGIQLGAHSGWLKTDKATDTATAITNTEYPTWVSGTTYVLDDIVVYKDTIYKCITAVSIEDAETNPKDLSSNWLSMGKVETEVLATNSYLYMPYSEEDKIELDININKYNSNADTNFIMSYEDGVPSKAYAYEYGAAGDGLYHDNTIRIGSPDCDVYIYHLRIYDKALSTADILQNFIADGNGISEKVERYNRNCIYWDSTQEKYFTSPSATAVLDPIKLAEVMPDVKVLMLDTPVFTVGKKNFVQNSSLRCIHAEGGNVYKSRGDADNWLFTNGFHSGQGTTSDNYGQSSRNVDFLFEVDGVNYPAKKKNMSGYTPSENYVSTVYIGENASTWNGTSWAPARAAEDIEICTYDPANGLEGWKGDRCKVSLTETSVPNNYFNLKVNVASSENVNNALFQKRYDDFLAYHSPAQTNQIAKHRTAYAALGLTPNKIKVKNSMEFVPAVLFVRENEPDITKHTEFTDTNWHFYSLGNIGDSKKTDYTRAYDPDDMNEFTLENSDNNTKNGQFQSGVYMDGNTRVVERNESGSNSMQFIWGLSDEEWNATREPTAEELAAAAEEDGIDVRLPNGQVYVNYRHRMLYAEPFDGDHSFEFRYACKGDYRDGDLINDTTGQAKAQEKLNTEVFYAFYDWLIMSDDATFKAEAPQWIVPAAMEFFYAYTHYYTMMDNRAKNTFWHFAKTGTYVEVSRPVKALLHVYEESSDNGQTWTQASGTEIDPNKKYRTQYAFDLWAYDMDTAAGIDNNGALVFPYGKEDSDYRTEGDPLSGYAFNGAGSIFWRRIKTSFANEIREIMTQTDPTCFNANDLINEFDTFQNCFPEEIWRLDIERKYIRTFTGESIDKSVTVGKQNPRFLTSMMQGRKKYQRRQWIRDQGVYFNSKYRLPDIIANENTLEFNATTPDVALWVSGTSYTVNDYVRVKAETFTEDKPRYEVYRCIEANSDTTFNSSKWHKSVTPSYYLQLTPYQDMYLNVQLGNGNYQTSYMTDGPATLRAKAGQTYTFDLFGSYQETRIYINGSKHLSAISNLGPMYPYKFDLRGLDHLKVLNIGVDESDYRNTKLDELVLPNFMPLLETVNVKNCHNLGKTLSLSTANNIRTVEAAGTLLSGVSLPDYTSITTLHLPATTIALNLYGARFLSDFKVYDSAGNVDYSSLFKLHIYDSDYSDQIDWMSIASDILSKQSLDTELSLLKLSTAHIGNIQELEPFSEFKNTLEAAGGILELSGILEVTGTWSEIEKDYYAGIATSVWPSLTLNTTGTEQTKHKVTYRYNNKEYSIYVTENTTAPDPYANGDIELPEKAADPLYEYMFGAVNTTTGIYIPYSGWKYAGSSVPLNGAPMVRTENIILEAYFQGIERQYAIRWFLDSERKKKVGEIREIPYGGGEEVLIPTVANIHEGNYMSTEGTYGQYETCTVSVDDAGPVTYSIFKGWDKSPVHIEPDGTSNYFDIFAVWENETTTVSEVFANVVEHELTPQQLLVLSAMSETMKNTEPYKSLVGAYDEGYQTSVQLGHDSSQNGTVIVSDMTDALYLSGSNGADDNAYSTNIQPFKNKAFTLVLDYTFADDPDAEENTFSVLASCYHSANNVKHGFGLFKNNTTNNIEIGFSNMYEDSSNRKVINNATNVNMRNIVVIRHPEVKSTDTYDRLYIYSSNGTSTSLPSEKAQVQEIRRTANSAFTSNAYLNIGQLIDTSRETVQSGDAILSITAHAKAKIHWAKYWDYDIGAGECYLLASWPHEKLTFGIARLYNDPNSVNTSRTLSEPTPSLYLTTLNSLTHGVYAFNRINQSDFNSTYNSYSWRDTTLRTLCNNRILMALPIKLQSVLLKPAVNTNTVIYNAGNNQGDGQNYALSSLFVTRDYVYAYSAANVLNDNNTYRQEDRLLSPFSWKTSGTNVITVYNYSTTSNSWVTESNSTSDYLNIRFPYKPISWGTLNKLRIYAVDQLSSLSTTAAAAIGRENLRSGDILIAANQAYIYVSNKEINRYGLYPESDNAKLVGIPDAQATQIDSTNLGSGGWIRSESYWTRSFITTTQRANLIDVSVMGVPNTSNVNNQIWERKINFIITL